MGNKLFKVLTAAAIGGLSVKTIQVLRHKKLQKELYGPGLEVDENSDKE